MKLGASRFIRSRLDKNGCNVLPHKASLLFAGIYTCVGPTTCAGCIGSEGHEEQDMQLFADWGAEYIKVDSCARNCTKAAGVPNASMPACGKTLWSRYTEAINKTGKPMVYSLIGNLDPARGEQPWKYAGNVSNSWRTNIDIQVGFQAIPYIVDCQRRMSGNGSWCPLNTSDPTGPGHPCKLDGSGPCDTCPGPDYYSRAGQWNDMDMLAIGTNSWLFELPLSLPQSRAQMSLWSLLKSPLLASADFTNISTPLLNVMKNEEILAISDDPLGKEALRLQGGASVGEIYVGSLKNQAWAVAFFNRNWGTNATMKLVLSDFLPKRSERKRFRVRDLWAHRELGVISSDGEWHVTVGGQDASVIRLTPLASPSGR